MMPAISGRANSRMEETPMTNSTRTITKVVREVLILLVKVCVILSFTTSLRSALGPWSFKFSRIRSKITMVALMEYPTMVRRQAMAVDPTDHFARA